jgi:hypothetical protein
MYRSFQEFVQLRETRTCESYLNAAAWAIQESTEEEGFEVVFDSFVESVALVTPDTTEKQLLQEFLSKLLGKAKSALGYGGQPAPAAPAAPVGPQLNNDQIAKFKGAAQTVSQAIQNAMMAVNQKIAQNKDKYSYSIMHAVQNSIQKLLQKIQTDPQSVVKQAGADFSSGMNSAFSGANPQANASPNDRFNSLSEPMKQRYAQTVAAKIGATGQEAAVLNLMNAGFTRPEQIKQQLIQNGKLDPNAGRATQDMDPAYKAHLAKMGGSAARPLGSTPTVAA